MRPGPPVVSRVLKTCSGGIPIFLATVMAERSSGSTSYSLEFEGNAEGFEDARAVGLHSVGPPSAPSEATRAGVQRQHPVGDGRGQLALVGGQDNRPVALAEAGQQLDHLAGALDVHVGEGLVEQQQLGHGEQHAGQRGALPHALRVVAEGAVELRVQTHLAQSLGWREAGAAGIEAGEVAQVFLGGQLVVEHGRVAHVADALAGLVRFVLRRRP